MPKLIIHLLCVFIFAPVLKAKSENDRAIDLGTRFEIKLRDKVTVSFNFLDAADLPNLPGTTLQQLQSTKNTNVLRNLMALDSGIRVYARALILPNGYVKLTARHGTNSGTLYIPPSNIISIKSFREKKQVNKSNKQNKPVLPK